MIARWFGGGWERNTKNAPPLMWMLWKQEQGKLLKAATAKEELKGQRSWEKVLGASRPPSKTLAKKSKLKRSSNNLITAIAHNVLASMAFLWITWGCQQTAYNSQNTPNFIHFQLVHKKTNTNFHRIGEKLDLPLHDLSHFLIYLLTEKSMNNYNSAKANCSDSALH